MARLRIRELAKDLGVKNSILLEILANNFGLRDLKPASGIDDDVAEKLRVYVIKEKDKGSKAEIIEESDGTVVRKHRTFVLRKRREVQEEEEVEIEEAEEVKEEIPGVEKEVAEVLETAEEGITPVGTAGEEALPEDEGEDIQEQTIKVEPEIKGDKSSDIKAEAEKEDDLKGKAEKGKKRKAKAPKKQPKGVIKKKALEELMEEGIDEEITEEKEKPNVVERVFEPGRSHRRKRFVEKERKGPSTIPPKPSKRIVKVEEVIAVGELAKRMGIKSNDIVRKFIDLDMKVTINQTVDAETAGLVAEEFGYKVENVALEYESFLDQEEDREEDLAPRASVVTIMGHVDHGKTSLLDAIRKTSVAESEAGGITQSIGAYEVEARDKKIVFVDTPGHEAFTQMRARGARVTDLVVLVVAADDGVMPQTLEAIDHARAAGVPIVIGINKIDKANANPDKVKKQLADNGLMPEDWGGDVLCANLSAKKVQGIDELLELIILQSEIMELKANPNKRARGIILESRLDKGRGPMATVIVQEGTLRIGDALISGTHYGKAKALLNHVGKRIKSAGPSTPVEVVGFNSVPEAGKLFADIESEKLARDIALARLTKEKEKEGVKGPKLSLEDLYDRIKEGELKELPVIIKGDVQGSVDALKDSLLKIISQEVRLNIIHSGVGGVNESDILLASASGAIILAFRVRPDSKALKLAEAEKVDVKVYEVIYELIDAVKSAMTGLLDPKYREVLEGAAEVREVFHIPKVGSVAGCYVTEGKVSRNSNTRVVRNSVTVYTGKIGSLKRFKDDVREVAQGYECGIGLENYNDVKEGDLIESFVLEELTPTL